MKNDMNKLLIEGILKKVSADLEKDPRRSLRKLVDLGVRFSEGPFQTKFLYSAQSMLRNSKSAYYTLLEDAAEHVDTDSMIRFGMNVGYNGAVLGSRKMRGLRDKSGLCVPWMLTAVVDDSHMDEALPLLYRLMNEGMALGIYSYILVAQSGPTDMLLPLLQDFPECAFVLWLGGQQLTPECLEHFRTCKNMMFVVNDDENRMENCRQLRRARMLYGVSRQYGMGDAAAICTGQWTASLKNSHPQFMFLIPEKDCPPEIRHQVYGYTLDLRKKQTCPAFVMELAQDMAVINDEITRDTGIIGFDRKGSLWTWHGLFSGDAFNLKKTPLSQILKSAVTVQPGQTAANGKMTGHGSGNGKMTVHGSGNCMMIWRETP